MLCRIFIQLTVLMVLLLCGDMAHASTLSADPDHIATGIEYHGTPSVRIGDDLQFGLFVLGGMIEVRNEERFNQGLFPNHNWRGFFFAGFDCPLFTGGTSSGIITTRFEHESAHPTMGFNEPTDDPYQMIYDGTYRNIDLNSFMLRYSHTISGSCILRLTCDLRFYFLSRNTPELPYTDKGWSEGISGGAEFTAPLAGPCDFFVSVFDRYIFRGGKEFRGDVYFSEGGVPVQKNVSYPVINSVNTVSLKSGVTLHDDDPGVKLSVYLSVLCGNIYGFVDSRDNRTQYAAGIEIVY